jgi:hypothetical protein
MRTLELDAYEAQPWQPAGRLAVPKPALKFSNPVKRSLASAGIGRSKCQNLAAGTCAWLRMELIVGRNLLELVPGGFGVLALCSDTMICGGPVWPLIAARRLQPVLVRSFGLARIRVPSMIDCRDLHLEQVWATRKLVAPLVFACGPASILRGKVRLPILGLEVVKTIEICLM